MDRQVIFSFSMISLSFFGSRSNMFTPTRANGFVSRSLTSDRSWGQLARQVNQYSDQK
jgi:hypothetical protein